MNTLNILRIKNFRPTERADKRGRFETGLLLKNFYQIYA